jgi:TRAP-type C4-dicarboxylate transport system substrate-binding protein
METTTMRNRSPVPIALAGAILLGMLALSPALAQKGPGDPEAPITLRLLIQDGQGRQSEAVANDLVALAAQLSDGLITIAPTFEGGDVASATMAGETDLGMVPSRDWDSVGVTSLDVLEAPFLIDNDALALAVATSDIAGQAMAGLDAVGVKGLAMWPEDLRHLFTLDPSGADLSTPGGLADSDILVVAGQPGHDLITQLGGRIYPEGEASGDLTGDRTADARTGTLEGMVTGLWGAGLPTQDVTVAGDLVVYSKYQMLVANAAVLDGLTRHQRELLDTIVAATREAALGHHFGEAELAAELCAHGATVIALGPAGVEAFRTAAQPLTDQLAADPVTGPLMTDVAALKANTPASPDAGTCEPAGAGSSPGAEAGLIGDQLPPDGTYRLDLVADELVALGADRAFAGDNAGVWTWMVSGDRWSLQREARGDHCTGSFAVADDLVTVTDDPGGTCSMGGHFQWRRQGDGLQFWYTDGQGGPMDARTLRIMNALVWSLVAEAPASLAP